MPYRPPIHNPIFFRPPGAEEERRRAQDPFYKSQEWRRTRQKVLRRCYYRCELHLEGCQGTAMIADHVIERTMGGSDDETNLRGVCVSCHNRRHPDRWRNRDA
jgi:5-methylcytosine-specific restriction endonuclease McrA